MYRESPPVTHLGNNRPVCTVPQGYANNNRGHDHLFVQGDCGCSQCPEGTFNDAIGSSNSADCTACNTEACGVGRYISSECSSSSDRQCAQCPANYYCADGLGRRPCPSSTPFSLPGSSSADDCSDGNCDASNAPTNGDAGTCTNSLANGASCTPTCDDGYTLSGTRTCNDGTLTDTAVCYGNSCDASSVITNGALNDCTTTLAHGATCTPTCNDGYTRSGTRSCAAGTLTDTVVCNPNLCTADPDNDSKNGDDGVFYCTNGGRVSGLTGSCLCTCNEGFEGASCETAGACSASPDSSKDGSDGSIYCGEHGSVGGTTGQCTCTCKPGYEGSGCETAKVCTASPDSTKDGKDGELYCSEEYGTIGGTTGECTCACKPGYGGAGCDTAGACSASPDSSKDGSDGSIYCVNGGTVSGSTGSCECKCESGYSGLSCEIASSPSMKAEQTRDTMLRGVTDIKLKKKAELLANAAIRGKKVKKMSAKLTAADADTACSDYYTKAGLSNSLGACIATAASRRRSLVTTTYDVSVFFSEEEVDEATLTEAENSLKADGVMGVETTDPIDPITELRTIDGVDLGTLETFETQAAAAAATMPPSPPPPPIKPPPPRSPIPDLALDDDDHAAGTVSFIAVLVATTINMLFIL